MKNRFKWKLRELRESKNITQLQLAQIFNMSKMGISHWEKGNGQPDYDTLIELAMFFGVTVDYLLGLEREDGTKINAINSFNNSHVNIQLGENNRKK